MAILNSSNSLNIREMSREQRGALELRAAHTRLRVVVMPLWKGEREQEAGRPPGTD